MRLRGGGGPPLATLLPVTYSPPPSPPPKEDTPLKGAPDEPEVPTRDRLCSTLPRPTLLLVLVLVVTSLSLNVLVLFPSTVFIELTTSPEILHSAVNLDGDWGLFHTIDILKQYEMWPLVVLLWGFSIIWPFAKLAWVVLLLFVPMSHTLRLRHIQFMGHAGRFSMLDILVVLLIMVVTADQQDAGPFHISITIAVRAGMFIFPAAILCSIAAVAVLDLAIDPIRYTTPSGAGTSRLCTQSSSGIVCVLASLLGLAACMVSIFAPLFYVDGIPASLIGSIATILGLPSDAVLPVLDGGSVSLAGALSTLVRRMGPSMVVFGLIIVLFLLLAPAGALLALLWMQLVPRDHVSASSRRLAIFLSTLSMSEVMFVAALIYMLTISEHLITVSIQPAFYGLAAFTLASPVALVSASFSARAC